MHEYVDRWSGPLVSADEHLTREFHDRVADSSTLAVRVAYSVLRNQQDAEDVAQEVFVRAHRRFKSLRDPECFRAWIVRMTWRMALDWQRSRRRREAYEGRAGREARPIGDAREDAVERERAERLWKAIDALTPKLRIVLVLAAIQGESIKDVARLLRLPEGTVKSRLFDARDRLHSRLR